MPTVTVEGPRIPDLDKKRELVKQITDVLERIYGLPREAYTVVIRENPPENVGVAGTLIVDRASGKKTE